MNRDGWIEFVIFITVVICLRVLSDWLDLKKIEFGYGVNHGK